MHYPISLCAVLFAILLSGCAGGLNLDTQSVETNLLEDDAFPRI